MGIRGLKQKEQQHALEHATSAEVCLLYCIKSYESQVYPILWFYFTWHET